VWALPCEKGLNQMTAILKAYADQLGVWQAAGMAKALGPKPTAEQIMTYARLGARHGKQCFAGAMALRELGVTGSEIVIACGAPQLNKMRGFIADALVKRVPLGKRNGNEIYKLVLTPKGEKRIANTLAREQAAEAAGAAADAVKPVKATTPAKGTKKATSKAAKPGKRVPAENGTVMTEAAASVTVNTVNQPAEPFTAADDRRLPENNVVTDQTNV
jgi:hypothetical protein